MLGCDDSRRQGVRTPRTRLGERSTRLPSRAIAAAGLSQSGCDNQSASSACTPSRPREAPALSPRIADAAAPCMPPVHQRLWCAPSMLAARRCARTLPPPAVPRQRPLLVKPALIATGKPSKPRVHVALLWLRGPRRRRAAQLPRSRSLRGRLRREAWSEQARGMAFVRVLRPRRSSHLSPMPGACGRGGGPHELQLATAPCVERLCRLALCALPPASPRRARPRSGARDRGARAAPERVASVEGCDPASMSGLTIGGERDAVAVAHAGWDSTGAERFTTMSIASRGVATVTAAELAGTGARGSTRRAPQLRAVNQTQDIAGATSKRLMGRFGHNRSDFYGTGDIEGAAPSNRLSREVRKESTINRTDDIDGEPCA